MEILRCDRNGLKSSQFLSFKKIKTQRSLKKYKIINDGETHYLFCVYLTSNCILHLFCQIERILTQLKLIESITYISNLTKYSICSKM